MRTKKKTMIFTKPVLQEELTKVPKVLVPKKQIVMNGIMVMSINFCLMIKKVMSASVNRHRPLPHKYSLLNKFKKFKLILRPKSLNNQNKLIPLKITIIIKSRLQLKNKLDNPIMNLTKIRKSKIDLFLA